jgi:phosphate/phosphite/phosphonate ABC transporter binding protein
MAALSTLLVPALSFYGTAPSAASPATQPQGFADPAFQTTWTRTDKLVADKTVVRSWYWGPAPGEAKTEAYDEGANNTRLVQYFDKSRMEINNPAGDKNSPFYVTNGLLTVELISGKMQVGNSRYETRYPANIPLASDNDDANAPTYASFALIANSPLGDHPAITQTGKVINTRVDRFGITSRAPDFEKYQVKYGFYNEETKHNIADKFWDFLNLSGPTINASGQTVSGKLSDPWFYTTGYAISEPYWANVKIAGKQEDVLIQLFERRVLTYVPSFAAEWRVQMGNIGAHYYDWRYRNAGSQRFPNPDVRPIQVPAGQLGSPQNPIKMSFAPSAQSTTILANGEPLAQLLGQVTGYSFKVDVPTSYAAVISGMGAETVDVAWLAPFQYALANQRFGVDVQLVTVRKGFLTYPSVFITADPNVKTVADLKGKKMAFVDPLSASGFLYPFAYLKNAGLIQNDPKEFFSDVLYAGGHDRVVTAVYNGQVSGGAVFGGPLDPSSGLPTDARSLPGVTRQFPDVFQKVRVIGESQQIPNDTVATRKGLSAEMKRQIQQGLLEVTNNQRGRTLLYGLYQIDDLAPVTDSFFDPLRQVARDAGFDDFEKLFPTPTPRPATTPTPTRAP